jgi:hypothetical protein
MARSSLFLARSEDPVPGGAPRPAATGLPIRARIAARTPPRRDRPVAGDCTHV